MEKKQKKTAESHNRFGKQNRDAVACSIRAKEGGDENNRVFTLSFSSEEPYERWFGNEILSHDGGAVNLKRLEEIGVVLYNHDRDKVIGKITSVRIENDRGEAEIEFDTDEFAETIRQKVASGTLKGVSVGYTVEGWESVPEGKWSQNGKFKGPCEVATHWTPFEISIVSVPADPTVGVGRQAEDGQTPESGDGTHDSWERAAYIRELQLQINKNL